MRCAAPEHSMRALGDAPDLEVLHACIMHACRTHEQKGEDQSKRSCRPGLGSSAGGRWGCRENRAATCARGLMPPAEVMILPTVRLSAFRSSFGPYAERAYICS